MFYVTQRFYNFILISIIYYYIICPLFSILFSFFPWTTCNTLVYHQWSADHSLGTTGLRYLNYLYEECIYQTLFIGAVILIGMNLKKN